MHSPVFLRCPKVIPQAVVRGRTLNASAIPADPLLGTADLQSLADLSNSVGIVRNMRWVPVSTRLLITVVIAALLPMLPLLLRKRHQRAIRQIKRNIRKRKSGRQSFPADEAQVVHVTRREHHVVAQSLSPGRP